MENLRNEKRELLRSTGKNYMIMVSEIPSINKVRWTMVSIGSKGKEVIECFMSTEDMQALCTDILTGTFVEKLAADENECPSAYKYEMRKDKSVHLNIGNGKVGVRIQMHDYNLGVEYMMAVSLNKLEDMAAEYISDQETDYINSWIKENVLKRTDA